MLPVIPRLKALWSGSVPLRHAFWDYAVFWGVLINLGTSALSLGFLLATRHQQIAAISPTTAGLLVSAFHLVPLPYNIVVLVGVWRSAGDPAVPSAASMLARAVTLVLFAAFLVI